MYLLVLRKDAIMRVLNTNRVESCNLKFTPDDYMAMMAYTGLQTHRCQYSMKTHGML